MRPVGWWITENHAAPKATHVGCDCARGSDKRRITSQLSHGLGFAFTAAVRTLSVPLFWTACADQVRRSTAFTSGNITQRWYE
jgi:hypothetical protein